MRPLSPTLLSAQKESSRTPFVKVEAANKASGVVRLDWTRLYSGSEDDYYHALTLPGDGVLIRVRVTPPADGCKLYRQRVVGPGPASDFSQWVYTGYYDAVVVAAASLGAEVSIIWINSSREIRRIESTDYGASWGSPEIIDYSPTTAINGLSAAHKPGGDLALFFADQATLFVKKRVSGSWQPMAAWDKTTGDLSGVAAVYPSQVKDWNLLVTGKDTAGNFKLWSLVYGDDGDVPSGTWSTLKEFASAPSDGQFEYSHVFMARPDVERCFYIEKFTGSEAYSRPFWSHSVPGAKFVDNLWREPVPFDLSSDYGLAIALHGDYCWLSCPGGVWRAALTEQTLDLTPDIVSLHLDQDKGSGKLTVELRNVGGVYDSPGVGGLSVLNTGSQINFSPGYQTAAGNEASPGLTFNIEYYEHTSSGNLVLYALDGWAAVAGWTARHQFRWNRTSEEMNVRDIIAFVLSRVGLKLEVRSQSSASTNFYPDFTINPGDSGGEVLNRLLSFVPDVLFIEGAKAWLVNPLVADGSDYSYGDGHPIMGGTYRSGAWPVSRVRVAGEDGFGQPVMTDSFDWLEIDRCYERMEQVSDRNLDSVEKTRQRGEALLRKAEIHSAGGTIIMPVNCGQQMYDVVDITDTRVRLVSSKRRVLGISLVYDLRKGEYSQRLKLGRV